MTKKKIYIKMAIRNEINLKMKKNKKTFHNEKKR